MKIIMDNDGTLTDFNKFVEENALDYFKQKYGMEIKYPDKLEIEDIFDMKSFCMEKYSMNEEQAEIKVRQILDEYWIGVPFIKFSLFGRFRSGVKEFINNQLKNGNEVQIHSSRSKTCDAGIIGYISRVFTIMQYRLNGVKISRKNIKFYKNDNLKIDGILKEKPDLVFEDKPEIIDELSKNNINTICVSGHHNSYISVCKNIERIDNFENDEIKQKMENLFGIKKLKYYKRAADSDIFFSKICPVSKIILMKFNPIVLNEDRLNNFDGEGVIYAPNHRSTIDPLVITSYVLKNIHWAALLRFFQGNDSIFNNSKNPVLCKITSQSFKKLEYFPIERKSDNEKANNFDAIKDMSGFLKIKQPIGIFPEGTTRREPGCDFGNFDDAFLALAKSTDSWVQPITMFWIKDLKIKEKLIMNIGEPFKVERMSVDQAMEYYMNIQQKCLNESKELYEKLIEKNCNKMKIKL